MRRTDRRQTTTFSDLPSTSSLSSVTVEILLELLCFLFGLSPSSSPSASDSCSAPNAPKPGFLHALTGVRSSSVSSSDMAKLESSSITELVSGSSDEFLALRGLARESEAVELEPASASELLRSVDGDLTGERVEDDRVEADFLVGVMDGKDGWRGSVGLSEVVEGCFVGELRFDVE